MPAAYRGGVTGNRRVARHRPLTAKPPPEAVADAGGARARRARPTHIRPSQSANCSSVQPRSLTRRCQSMPSVIDQITSRHSCSVTASCPVAAASGPSRRSRRGAAGPSPRACPPRPVRLAAAPCTHRAGTARSGAPSRWRTRRAACRRVARSGSARIAMTSGRSWNTTSSSSPPTVMSQARCSNVALFLKAA